MKSFSASFRVETAANHEATRSRPNAFVTPTDPPTLPSTSRKETTTKRQRPTVMLAITSPAKLSPTAAAIASLGSIPASIPTPSPTAPSPSGIAIAEAGVPRQVAGATPAGRSWKGESPRSEAMGR